MSLRHYPARLLLLSSLSSLLLLGLCGTLAVYLAREQTRTAAVLGEDIGSRGAAINLEVTLSNLATLHDRNSQDVEALHEQVRTDLTEIERFADKPEEQVLARQVAELFAAYREGWLRATPPNELARFIRERLAPAADALRTYNGRELKQSEEGHRRSLQRMVWGLVVVCGLGSVAGLVFGYGLARSLRQTIHQFLVRVQGASDLLGQELPLVEWQRQGEPLGSVADDLLRRVEDVVLKLQQKEREVRRAERLAAIGQLAAGLAHEIRNPLTSAVLLIETARKDPTSGGLTDEDLHLIETELQRIEQSLRLFLDFARPPQLTRSAVDVGMVVKDALNLARGRIDQQQVVVHFVEPTQTCTLNADREHLRQVVLNLLLNALDMMPHGGTLGVAVGPASEGRIVELSVTDTGPGISPAILPRLFEPFATNKETGIGLGLVVSKRIVEDHGGSIRGANRPEGGACFTVRLPRTSLDGDSERLVESGKAAATGRPDD